MQKMSTARQPLHLAAKARVVHRLVHGSDLGFVGANEHVLHLDIHPGDEPLAAVDE